MLTTSKDCILGLLDFFANERGLLRHCVWPRPDRTRHDEYLGPESDRLPGGNGDCVEVRIEFSSKLDLQLSLRPVATFR